MIAGVGPYGYDFDGGHVPAHAADVANVSPGQHHHYVPQQQYAPSGVYMPNAEEERRLLQTVREQEEQFDRLTRELEAERLSAARQLEKFKLVNSDTTSASSLTSGTDVTFRPKAFGGNQGRDPLGSNSHMNGSSAAAAAAARRPAVADGVQPMSPASSYSNSFPVANGVAFHGNPDPGDAANRSYGIGNNSNSTGSSPWKASQTSLSRHQWPEGQHHATADAGARADSEWTSAVAEPAGESYHSDFFTASPEASLPYGHDLQEGQQPWAMSVAPDDRQPNGSASGRGSQHALNHVESPYADFRRSMDVRSQDYANMRVSRDFGLELEEPELQGTGNANGYPDPRGVGSLPYGSSQRSLHDLHDHTMSDQWDRASHNGSSRGYTAGGYGPLDATTDSSAIPSGGQFQQYGGLPAEGSGLSGQPRWPSATLNGGLNPWDSQGIFDNGVANQQHVAEWMPSRRSSAAEAHPEAWQPWPAAAADRRPSSAADSQNGRSPGRRLDYPDGEPGYSVEEADPHFVASRIPPAAAVATEVAATNGSRQPAANRPPSIAGSEAAGPPGYSRPTERQELWPSRDAAKQTPSYSTTSLGRDVRQQWPPRIGELSTELNDIIEGLEHPNSTTKANAAAYLQHVCYRNSSIKAKMRALGAVPALLKLLDSAPPSTQRLALGGLLNLSHGPENADGKKEIMRCAGLEKLGRLLRSTQDSDIRELVTGILWNMSSCKDLKRPIIDSSLTILVNEVIIPHSGFQQQQQQQQDCRAADELGSSGVICWPAVFRNASGVLRNVSSDGYYARKRLREFPGLVPSLIHLVKAAIGKNDIDNKSVENSICVLRNLSYRLMEVDYPDHYDDDNPNRPNRHTDPSALDVFPGCCGAGGQRAVTSIQKVPYHSRTTAGAGRGELLWQPDMVGVYLPLLADCSNPDTLEAAAGAVQNLAACEWQPSAEFREKVRKEKGLPVIVELLGLDADGVVCSAAIALRNLALDQRNKELIGKYAIQQLVARLPAISGFESQFKVSEATMRAIMATLHEVIKNTVDHAGTLAGDGDGIARLMAMAKSRNRYESRTLRCVHQLLATLWGFAELRTPYKSRGWREPDFILKTMHPRSSSTTSPVPSSSPASTLSRAHHHASASSVNLSSWEPVPGATSASTGARTAAYYPSNSLQSPAVRGAASLSRSNQGFCGDESDDLEEAQKSGGASAGGSGGPGGRADPGDHWPQAGAALPRAKSSGDAWASSASVSGYLGHASATKSHDRSPASNATSNDYVTYPAYRVGTSAVAAEPALREVSAPAAYATDNEPLYARLAKRGGTVATWEQQQQQQQQLTMQHPHQHYQHEEQHDERRAAGDDADTTLIQLQELGIATHPRHHHQPLGEAHDDSSGSGIYDFSRGSLLHLQGAIDDEAKLPVHSLVGGGSNTAIDSWV